MKLCASDTQEPNWAFHFSENTSAFFIYTVNVLLGITVYMWYLSNSIWPCTKNLAHLNCLVHHLLSFCFHWRDSARNKIQYWELHDKTVFRFQKERTIQISNLDRSESSRFSAALISFIVDNAHNISKSRSHSACQMDWAKFKLEQSVEWISYSSVYICKMPLRIV
jgi:hypothetical protein